MKFPMTNQDIQTLAEWKDILESLERDITENINENREHSDEFRRVLCYYSQALREICSQIDFYLPRRKNE